MKPLLSDFEHAVSLIWRPWRNALVLLLLSLALSGICTAAGPAELAVAPAVAHGAQYAPHRSSELELMVRRAEEHTRYAFELAQRGATYSAEAHFIQALKLITQGIDAERGTDLHYRALVAGLRALQEVDDFAGAGHDLFAESDVAGPLAAHRTTILKPEDVLHLTPAAAAQRYCEYAQAQLAFAGGVERAASEALYGLARVHSYLARDNNRARPFGWPKATALHRAAIAVDPKNYLSANELGVLLARYGHDEQALRLFRQSVSVSQQPVTWKNLSVVYARRGDQPQRDMAWQQHTRLATRRQGPPGSGSAGPAVRWVSYEEFVDQPTFSAGLDEMPLTVRRLPSTEAPHDIAATPTKTKWSHSLAEFMKNLSRGFRRPENHIALPAGDWESEPSFPPVSPLSPAATPSSDAAAWSGTQIAYQTTTASESVDPAVQPFEVFPPSGEEFLDPMVVPPTECPTCGVHCGGRCDDPCWESAHSIPWQMLAQGEYIGPPRLAHLPEYRLRVDDIIEFVYRLDGKPSSKPYELEVGDQLRIEALEAEELNRDVIVQPDGQITLRLLGQVRAAGRALDDLREDLEERYRRSGVRRPSISITPIKVNTTAVELINTVDRRFGAGGQAQQVRITPAGTVQLPAIGSVPAQGLTLSELKYELERRYAVFVAGMEITPILVDRAPRFFYVVGEVRNPGRFVMEAPTTLMQSIALAGGWNVGAHLNHIVVFRRDENWQLMATHVSLRDALYGHSPCPPGEIWLRDSDIVLVPKHPVLTVDDAIELLFTRGLYSVVPISYSINFRSMSGV